MHEIHIRPTSPCHSYSVVEEPSDWAQHFFGEPGPDFREVTKKRALKVLDNVAFARECAIAEAIAKHVDLRFARDVLISSGGTEPAMLEFHASVLPSIFPPAVQEWPVWFVRLPEEWTAHMGQFLHCESFGVYGDQHPLDPWYITQWLSLHADSNRRSCDDKHLRVCADDIARTLRQSEGVDGVVVFFECQGRLSLTAYPIDDGIFVPLQAGYSSSNCRPLLSNTLAMLQWQVRALDEGMAPQTPGVPLRVAKLLSEDERKRRADACDVCKPLRGERASVHLAASEAFPMPGYRQIKHEWVSAVIGRLPTVSGCASRYPERDSHLWLKVSVVDEFFQEVASLAPLDIRFEVSGRTEDATMFSALVVTCGSEAVRVTIDGTWPAPADAMRDFLNQERAWLCLESYRSGYLHFIELPPPAKRVANRYDGDACAKALGRDVRVYESHVLDAKTWQRQQPAAYPDVDSPVGFEEQL